MVVRKLAIILSYNHVVVIKLVIIHSRDVTSLFRAS